MLPSTLTPTTVEPEWGSLRSQMSTALKKVDCIHIKRTVSCDGVRRYVIEVYAHTSKNRIPTNWSRQGPAARTSLSPGRSHTPVARVERKYSDFTDLRGEVYNHAHDAHDLTPCDFCQRVIDEIVWGDSKPSNLRRLLASKEKVVEMLAASVNTLLDLVKSNRDGRLCDGQDKIPQVLYDFLFKQDSAWRGH